MFVKDYRPTKSIGVDELHGAILMLRDKIDEMSANGEAGLEYYEGAYFALCAIRDFNFEYPRDFLATFTRSIHPYIS